MTHPLTRRSASHGTWATVPPHVRLHGHAQRNACQTRRPGAARAAGPSPTPDQREDPGRRPRAGAATQSLPPAYEDEDEDGPTADERLDGGPLEREQVFHATFDRAVIGIAHVSPEGRWLRVNQRLCNLLGYDRAELAARTWQEITHPADLPTDRAAARRLL